MCAPHVRERAANKCLFTFGFSSPAARPTRCCACYVRAMGQLRSALVGALAVVVVGCGGDGSGEQTDAGADASPDAGSGGLSGSGGTGGVGASGGASGSGGATGGAAGSGGTSTGGTGGVGGAGANGGAGGTAGFGGSSGSAGSGGSAGSSGSAGSGGSGGSAATGGMGGAAGLGGMSGAAGAGGALTCGLDEACCAGSTCDGDLQCAGTACSCIKQMYGATDLRTDGTVIFNQGGLNQVIEVNGGAPLSGITQIYEGFYHGCARKDDGTVWCWPTSTNARGRHIGDGTMSATGPLYVATQVLSAENTPLTGVREISGGSARCYLATNTCAIKTDGTLWCWGDSGNASGGAATIFHGDTANKAFAFQMMASPTEVLTGVDAVTLGLRHMCVLQSGEVSCWGANVGGPLGQDDETQRNYPTKVTLPGSAQQVGAGADVTCARVSDTVYCWGANGSGQVGVGVPSMNTDSCINPCVLEPAQVVDNSNVPLSGVLDLSVAYLGVCVTKTDHSLWCWGGTAGNVASPLLLVGNPVTDVSLYTHCGAGELSSAVRYLTRDNELFLGSNPVPVTQTCP